MITFTMSFAGTVSDTQASSADRKADFNGDGFADLAIGVPLEDIGTKVNAGVNGIYGSSV
jgi:hypothetical protein